MKSLPFACALIAVLFLNANADPISEPLKSISLNPLPGKSTAWSIDGKNAKKEIRENQTFCNYVGRVSLKEAPGGYCPDITIWHIKKVYGNCDEKNGQRTRCRDAICEYDIKQPGGGVHLTAMNRRKCPDILVSMIIRGKMTFVGEWNLQKDEEPELYFKKGIVEVPLGFDINPVFVKFMGKKYEDQLDYWYAQFRKWDAQK